METLKSYNPATGEILGEVEITPAVVVPNMVTKARAAQLAWGDLGLEGRAELIKTTADIFVDRVQGHGELMTKEMGKPLKEAFGEAKSLGWGIEEELAEIIEALKPEVVEDGRLRSTGRAAFGKCGQAPLCPPYGGRRHDCP